MNPLDHRTQHRNRLLAGYLTDSLSARERQNLLRELAADEAFAREAATLRRHDRVLETMFHMAADTAFVEKTVASSLFARDRNAFVQRVLSKAKKIERHRAEWAARNRERRRIWAGLGWAAAATMLLTLGAALYLNRTPVLARPASLAQLALATPDVLVQRNGTTLPAVTGMPLHAGDRIQVPFGRNATLTLSQDSARIEMREATALTLHSEEDGIRLDMARGALRVEAAPRAATIPLLFVTPQSVARVVGTDFSLSAEGAATRLDVFEGKVDFTDTASGETVPVPHGHYARAGGDRPFTARPIPTGDNIRYGPGRVLFEDNFADGLIHWHIVQAPRDPEHAKFTLADDDAQQQINVGQAPRNGSTEPCLVFHVEKDSPSRMGLRLKNNVQAHAYQVEWLFRVEHHTGPGKAATLIQPGVTDFRIVHKQQSAHVALKRWFRRKLEVYPIPSDESGPWWQVNLYQVDPKPIRTNSYNMRIDPEQRGSVMLELGQSPLLIGQCVIREMVPEAID